MFWAFLLYRLFYTATELQLKLLKLLEHLKLLKQVCVHQESTSYFLHPATHIARSRIFSA